MQNFERHINCPSHLDAVAHYVADQDQQKAIHLMELDSVIEQSPPLVPDELVADPQSVPLASPPKPPSPLSFNTTPDGYDPLGLFDKSDAKAGSDQELDFIMLQQAFEELGQDASDSEEDPVEDEDYADTLPRV